VLLAFYSFDWNLLHFKFYFYTVSIIDLVLILQSVKYINFAWSTFQNCDMILIAHQKCLYS